MSTRAVRSGTAQHRVRSRSPHHSPDSDWGAEEQVHDRPDRPAPYGDRVARGALRTSSQGASARLSVRPWRTVPPDACPIGGSPRAASPVRRTVTATSRPDQPTPDRRALLRSGNGIRAEFTPVREQREQVMDPAEQSTTCHVPTRARLTFRLSRSPTPMFHVKRRSRHIASPLPAEFKFFFPEVAASWT